MSKVSSAREHVCKINDDDGVPVDYALVPHRASEGLDLAKRLFVLAAPMLAQAQAASSVGDMDAGKVAEALGAALAASDVPAMVADLLKNTRRNGLGLDQPGAVDLVYAGNYGELADAVVWAINCNGFHRFFVRLAGQAGGLGLGRE